ncbi:MAG: hypothetical protein ACUVXI_00965 [bacterium]
MDGKWIKFFAMLLALVLVFDQIAVIAMAQEEEKKEGEKPGAHRGEVESSLRRFEVTFFIALPFTSFVTFASYIILRFIGNGFDRDVWHRVFPSPDMQRRYPRLRSHGPGWDVQEELTYTREWIAMIAIAVAAAYFVAAYDLHNYEKALEEAKELEVPPQE